MKKLFSFSLMLLTLLGGCKSVTPREDVFVLDISQSIDADAEQQMFVAVEDVAQHLRRGDNLTIIPITGNAVAELQGRTLHYVVPSSEDRQAYDADLRKLNVQIKDDIARLQAEAVAHPGNHTDIIGSIRVAVRQFSGRSTEKQLIVLSDFIQDDTQLDFGKDTRLTGPGEEQLARFAIIRIGPHPQVKVFLGRLRSVEFSSLARSRQHAIDAFWEQVMSPAQIEPDGLRQLSKAGDL